MFVLFFGSFANSIQKWYIRSERWKPFPLLPHAIMCEEKHLFCRSGIQLHQGRVFSPRTRPELDFDALATGIWSISPPRRAANCQLKLLAEIFPAACPSDGSRERTFSLLFLFLMRTRDFNFPTRWMRHLVCNLIWRLFLRPFCSPNWRENLPPQWARRQKVAEAILRLKKSPQLVLCVDTISSLVKGFWNNALRICSVYALLSAAADNHVAVAAATIMRHDIFI